MKIKIIKYICKLLNVAVFTDEFNGVSFISKHALKRSEQRLSYSYLLDIAAETALEKGHKSVHFDYVNNQIDEFAKLYKGVVYIYSKSTNRLITVYPSNKSVELYVTRQ